MLGFWPFGDFCCGEGGGGGGGDRYTLIDKIIDVHYDPLNQLCEYYRVQSVISPAIEKKGTDK